MPCGFDHFVHAVRDLDAAAEIYRRAGFMVGARNQHPWGTHNRIVQLGNAYIELLEVAEPEKIAPPAQRSFSFGAYNRDYLVAHEGLSMLILNSRDAAADARGFAASGIGDFDVFEFAREGKRPDGSVVKLAFSLAFAQDNASPDLRFAVCQHYFPENFWNPAFQIHANGAKTVPGAIIVSGEPAGNSAFLTSFTGAAVLQSRSAGIVAVTNNGEAEIMPPAAFRDLTGVTIEPDGAGMTLNALRFAVADLAVVESLHRDDGIASRRHGGRIVVPPEIAFGATLIFEAAKPA
jgi:hypothetical protein